jgi:hypothetical protein
MNLNMIIQLARRLRMSGVVPLLYLYDVTAWTAGILNFTASGCVISTYKHWNERETVSVWNSAGSSTQFSSCVPFHWCQIKSTHILFREFQSLITRETIGPFAGHCYIYCHLHTERKLKSASFLPTFQAPGQEWVRMVKATWKNQYIPLKFVYNYTVFTFRQRWQIYLKKT